LAEWFKERKKPRKPLRFRGKFYDQKVGSKNFPGGISLNFVKKFPLALLLDLGKSKPLT